MGIETEDGLPDTQPEDASPQAGPHGAERRGPEAAAPIQGVAVDWRDPRPPADNTLRVIVGLRAQGKLGVREALDVPKLAEISGESEAALRGSNPKLLQGTWE
jgi:hypothetical protein